MLFDGYWKWDLQKQSWAISFWRRLGFLDEITEHALNRAVLYSAAIIRKAGEDEIETERLAADQGYTFPKQELPSATLDSLRFPFIGDPSWLIRGKFFSDDYGSSISCTVSANQACNWILHSYVWRLVSDHSAKAYSGFILSSDRTKTEAAYYISFDEWQKLIRLVLETGAF